MAYEELFRGYVTLCSSSGEANFEQYCEAWHLLREASEAGEVEPAQEAEARAEESPAAQPGGIHPGNMQDRMEWVANLIRTRMGRSNLRPRRDEEV